MRKLKNNAKRLANAVLAAAPILATAITQPRQLRVFTLIKAATAFKDAWYNTNGN